MQRMQEMQEKLQQAKKQLDHVTAEAEAGGGMVRVTATANHKIINMKISADIIDKNDPEMLEDLITAAVNRALEMAEEKGKEEMQKATQGLLPPGFDLGKIGYK